MTSLFGLKKTIAAIPAVGAVLILGSFTALANGSAPVDNLQQCQDSTGATCTNVQETSAKAVHRNSGPSVIDSNFATIITLGNLDPGNYVVTAKTVLFSNTASGFAFCELIVSPPGGASGIVDFWEWSTATATTTTYTANMQRPVTLNPSLSTSYTIQVGCEVFNIGTGGWSAFDSSIIANQVQNLDEQEVNS